MAKQSYRFQVQDRKGGKFVVFDLQENRVLSEKFGERQQAIRWCFNNVMECDELQYRPGKKVYHRKNYGPIKLISNTEQLKDLGKRLEKVRDLKKEVATATKGDNGAWEPAYISTHSGNYTVVVGKKTFTFGRSHKCYNELVKAIANKDLAAFEANIDTVQGIKTFFKENAGPGKIEIKDGEITFKGEVVHHVLVGRIFEAMEKGLPHENLVKFLENLLQNPNKESVESVYKFLEDKGLPINHEGYFLAYKKVREDFKDWNSGTFDNHPGQVLSVNRENCDSSRYNACSHGLHIGSMYYAKVQFYPNQGILLLVKCNPKNVVSTPADATEQKLRTCEYEVLEILEDYRADAIKKPVEPVQLEPDLDDEDLEDDDSSLEDWADTYDSEDSDEDENW